VYSSLTKTVVSVKNRSQNTKNFREGKQKKYFSQALEISESDCILSQKLS